MRSPGSQPPIRPQISTMPRPKTEAAAYLSIYKLVSEKKRLEQELQGLDQRRDRICQRLDVLNNQVATLKDSLQDFQADAVVKQGAIAQPQKPQPDGFSTLFLEY